MLGSSSPWHVISRLLEDDLIFFTCVVLTLGYVQRQPNLSLWISCFRIINVNHWCYNGSHSEVCLRIWECSHTVLCVLLINAHSLLNEKLFDYYSGLTSRPALHVCRFNFWLPSVVLSVIRTLFKKETRECTSWFSLSVWLRAQHSSHYVSCTIMTQCFYEHLKRCLWSAQDSWILFWVSCWSFGVWMKHSCFQHAADHRGVGLVSQPSIKAEPGSLCFPPFLFIDFLLFHLCCLIFSPDRCKVWARPDGAVSLRSQPAYHRLRSYTPS